MKGPGGYSTQNSRTRESNLKQQQKERETQQRFLLLEEMEEKEMQWLVEGGKAGK
jgi:hypothetical protein